MPALAITMSRLSNSYSAVRDLIPRLMESEDATSISMTISWEPEDFGKDLRDSAVAILRTAATTVVFGRPRYALTRPWPMPRDVKLVSRSSSQ
jgi:hypothetical protein